MLQHDEIEIRELLNGCRQELEEAGEHYDWELMTEVNKDVRQLMTELSADNRVDQFQQEIAALKNCYQNIFSMADERRNVLQQCMSDVRQQRGAFKKYEEALAAGNRELRANL